MRSVAQWLLLGYIFSLPWAYSLDLGEPWGNIARLFGVLTLAITLLAVLERREINRPRFIGLLALGYFLLQCSTLYWTISEDATWIAVRGSFQKMMVIWLTLELADERCDLRRILRAAVSGMAVLAILTLISYRTAELWEAAQIRYAAEGQDPNDTAHFLALSLPLASLLAVSEAHRFTRWLAIFYQPLALAALLLTASRGGFLALLVALPFSGWIFYRKAPRRTVVTGSVLMTFFLLVWIFMPSDNFTRLATIPEQLSGGGLNERTAIWESGLDALHQTPLLGSGAGSFVLAAHTAWMDSAHNSLLSIAVQSGLPGILLVVCLVTAAFLAACNAVGALQAALIGSLLVCAVSAQVSTIEESRPAWLLLAIVALAGHKREPLNGLGTA